MAGKFTRSARLVLALLTVLILASQLMGCGERTPPAGPESEAPYDGETGAVDAEEPETDSTEAEEEAQEAAEYGTRLSIIYQAAYESGTDYASASLEDQLNKEICDLETLADGFVTLPENYQEAYKAWRIENCGGGFTQAETAVKAEAPAAEYGFTDADEMMYTTGTVNIRTGPGASYDKIDSLPKGWEVHRIGTGTGTAEGWSLIEFEGGLTAYISSSYLSYDKPVVQAPSGGSQQSGSTQQSDANDDWGDFNPREGLTEEEIQQKIENSYNTVFRVHGT